MTEDDATDRNADADRTRAKKDGWIKMVVRSGFLRTGKTVVVSSFENFVWFFRC